MNEKQIRVIDAIEALRADAPKTMARLGQLVAAHDSAVALSEARAFRMESIKSAARRTGFEPRAEDARRVDELVASLEMFVVESPTEPRPLISDATLAKIVRLVIGFDCAPDFWVREIVELITRGNLASALDHARQVDHVLEVADPDRAQIPSLIAALEDANEESARNTDVAGKPMSCDGCEFDLDIEYSTRHTCQRFKDWVKTEFPEQP